MKDVKSKTKRLLALLLAVVMVFSSVPNVTTYFANTENSGSEGGEGGSESEAEKNNAAVSIKLTDSYNGDAITGDITVKYALLKGSETLTEDTEWTTVNDSLNEEGVITVLKEKSISISDTKLYVQVEKENYIAYQSTAIELREYDENSTPDSVEFELDMELLKGINHDYDGNAIPVAEINSVWETLLNADGIIVSYALKCDGEDIELEDISMMPEVKDVGTYELTITVSKQDGSEAEWTQTVTSKIIKASIENVSIKAKDDLVYGGIEQEFVKLIGTGLQTGDTITWYVKSANENDEKYEEVASYSYAEDEDIELPKMTDAGNYTVKIVVQRENYNDYTQVVENIQIHPGKIDLGEITITGYGGAYDGKEHDAVKVESEREYAYTLQYQLHECTSENCDHLTIDEDAWQDECPKVKDAGSYIVWVKAVVDDSNYEDTDVSVEKAENAVAPFNVYIEKYTPEISFIEDEFNKETSSSKVAKTDIDNGVKYVFGATYVGDVQPSEKITYSVLKQATDGEFVEDETATIDDAGNLTLKEEGVYQITASSAGNENFEESSITHILYVGVEAGTDAGDKLITFEDSQVDYIFNINSTSISDFTAEKTYATDNGTVTYSIDKTLDDAIEIDSATGKVTVKDYEKLMSKINTPEDKTVTLTVTAEKAAINYSGTGNVQYGVDSDSYEITLKFIETPANPYKITGTINEENNWYSTKVTLTAPDDYTISKSLENFAESVTYDEQGALENSYVYLMDEEGYITAPILVQNEDGINFQIDTVDPGTVTVKYSDPTELEKLLEKIFRFYQSSVELTFTSTDETSGVDYFAWKYIREDDASSSNVASDEDWNKAAAEWDEDTKQYTATITLSASEAAQYRGHIVVHAVDKAENKSAETEDTGNVFVVDSISPKVTISYSTDGELVSTNAYKGNINVQIHVKEMNFYEEDVQVSVTKDGTEIQVPKVKWNKDTKNTDTYIGTFTITGDGNYIVSVKYVNDSDKSGNPAEFIDGEESYPSYTSKEMVIDTTPPVVDITYKQEAVEGKEDKQTVTFTITECNFNPANIKITGSRTIANGENILESAEIETLLKNTEIQEWEKKDDTYSYTCDFADGNNSYFEGNYNLTLEYTDIVALKATATEEFTIDHTKLTMQVDYSDSAQTVGGVAYYKNVTAQNPVQVTLNVVEANFEAGDMVIAVTKDGTAYTLNDDAITWTTDANNGANHTGVISLTEEGHYTITVNYKDHWNNVMDECTTQTLVIDNTAPVIDVEYKNLNVTGTFEDINGYNREYFADTQVAEIKIKERNFRFDDVTYTIKVYDDITGKEITASNLYTVTECVPGDEEYTYTFTITYPGDANYSFDISCEDLAKNASEDYEIDYFTVDTTPSDVDSITIGYKELNFIEIVIKNVTKLFGFTNEKVTVTFTASDTISGIKEFVWKYEKDADASNTNHQTTKWETTAAELITNPDGTKVYTAEINLPKEASIEHMRGNLKVKAVNKSGLESYEKDDAGRIFVIDTISPKMQVNYPNPKKESEDGSIKYYHEDVEITFSVEEVNFFNENVKVSVSKDGFEAQPVTVEWTSNGDNHIGTYTLTGAGDYVVYVEYSDYSGNVMKDENEVEIKQYQSHIITIDTKNPEVKMEFDKGTQTTTFTIEEHNFDPTKITVTGERKDLNGKELDFAAVKLQEILQNAEWTKAGDIYAYTYDYKKVGESFDGIYNLTINCTDLSGRAAETYKPGTFTIDRCKPTDVEITYSDPLKETFIEIIIENIMETITLGFYNPDVTITLTTYDAYSDVKYFEWKHTRQNGVSEDNRPTDTEFTVIEAVPDREDKTKFTATFNLPESEAEQIRGWLAVKATDNYKNESNLANDDKKILVVDTVSPTIQVEYTPADRVVGTTSYYNNNVDITFTVDEANFFAEDVIVKVSKDGGEAVVLETIWTDQSADIHIGKTQLSGDGDYVIIVEYTDRSNNEMVKYTSNVHTIDTIAPVIKVEYQNTTVINTLEDRNEQNRSYFTDTQTAVVTITEHNFNAEDVVWMLTATDVTGKELDINSLHVKGAWEDGDQADTHTLTIIYSGDANYTFDMAYSDLATNEAVGYATDYFTVDNTAPVNLKVDYSTSLLETILETITFGFYNASVEVTLTAEDITSGVHGFVYNYTNASGVSDVNAELLAQAIEAAEITYSNEGQTATVKFNIPKAVLGNTNQFNGTISFETTDRSGIKSVFADEKRIVVDNIAPTAQVTYNQPVNTEGSISYYAGDITATVVINEANFYAEDVVVMVTKDGGTATAITPSWVDNSVDVHTGTFTLTEDGDYFITINYQDKSTNQMAQYTSDQLTIDTDIQAPVISFNGNNENGHAYKGEVVPSISFSDINYDSYEVHLYRTYKGALNVEITEEKGLMGMFSVGEQDGNASFDIFAVDENGKYKAEDDGIYHLTITMNDKAGHQINSEAYFTVNRYGSVYEYGEYLVSLISDGGAFKQEITEDITITEYNADRLVGNSLNIEITRDGKPLDTVKYTVSPEINEHVAVGESGWFQYQYTISKNNFVQDGIYKISVSSKDATGNAPENSNFEDKNILFYVDSTVPEITSITGLEESIVDNTELTIRYMIFDTMALKSVTVYVDGEVLDEITDFSSDLNNYEGEFTLQESEEQRSIRIVAEDKAGNITDTASEDFTSAYVFNDKVIVTTNAFVRFFANKPLFYGSITAVVTAIAAIGVGIQLKRKKKIAK